MGFRHPRSIATAGAALLLAACGHSDAFVTGSNAQTAPFVSGADTRLTYNADQDYWPAWSEDSSGVLYAYVAVGRADHDRCVGLLNPATGTRVWQMCDNQPGHGDSTDSFTAYALGRDGRLLYQEVTARIGTEVPTTKALWLADSAHPFTRKKVLALPVRINAINVDWLADLAWTGPSDFIALAEEYTPVPHCLNCIQEDSAFVGKFVVKGHLDASGATLTPINGTEGANSYALAEHGNSIVFALRTGNQLYGVALAGGTAALLGTVGSQSTVTGITCLNVICIVATDQVVLLPNAPGVLPSLNSPAGNLYRYNITTGVATVRRSAPPNGNSGMYSSPLLAPNGTDLIVQTGGSAGRLHSASSPNGDLYLYKGILP